LVVGGVAVHLHAPAREIAGADLDLLVESTTDNAKRVIRALYARSITPDFDEGDIAKVGAKPQQLRLKPVFHADILTGGPGINFEEEWQRALEVLVNGKQVRCAHRDLLIRMKRGTGRPKDQDDITLLESSADGTSTGNPP